MVLSKTFPKTFKYVDSLDVSYCDLLDKTAKDFFNDENYYDRAAQAIRRRFVRGAEFVYGIDRGNKRTKIKRVSDGGKFRYFIEGNDGNWSQPDERIWVVAMYALRQKTKGKI